MERPVSSKRIPRRDLNRESYASHSGDKRSLQDQFLTEAIASGVSCDVYLKNESVRHGVISAYDNWSLLLHAEGKQYLIFKSGIMSIIPSEILYIDTDYPLRGTNRVADPPGRYLYGNDLM